MQFDDTAPADEIIRAIMTAPEYSPIDRLCALWRAYRWSRAAVLYTRGSQVRGHSVRATLLYGAILACGDTAAGRGPLATAGGWLTR